MLSMIKKVTGLTSADVLASYATSSPRLVSSVATNTYRYY